MARQLENYTFIRNGFRKSMKHPVEWMDGGIWLIEQSDIGEDKVERVRDRLRKYASYRGSKLLSHNPGDGTLVIQVVPGVSGEVLNGRAP